MSDAGARTSLSNLQVRILSAIVLSVVVLALTWLGGLPFRLFAVLVGAAIFYEWIAMSGLSGRSRALAAVALAIVMVALLADLSAVTVLALLAVAVLVSALEARMAGQGFWAPAGLAYAGLSAVTLAFLRDGDHAGFVAILFLFAVVWSTDILAYFVGRSLGGPKLAPRISPGKTWSGAIGGGAGGVVAGAALALWAGMGNLPVVIVIALVLSIVSQAGDLFESWVKRRSGVKDSGSVIPGHGGVMDRVDGLVAAAVALYAVGCLLGNANNPAQALFAI